jgi:hypothetical protein
MDWTTIRLYAVSAGMSRDISPDDAYGLIG